MTSPCSCCAWETALSARHGPWPRARGTAPLEAHAVPAQGGDPPERPRARRSSQLAGPGDAGPATPAAARTAAESAAIADRLLLDVLDDRFALHLTFDDRGRGFWRRQRSPRLPRIMVDGVGKVRRAFHQHAPAQPA